MQSSPRRRRPGAIAGSIVLALATLVGVSLSSTPVAVAQDRPPCSDGPANAWDQVRGEILDSILPDWVNHPYGPESIDEVADRCLQLPFPDAGAVPGIPGGPGTNSGDPHIVTQDGLAYDFHGAGDYILLRSAANDVEMQVRYRRSKFVSLFAGVAIRDGDTTLTVENFVRGEDPVVTLDGEPLAFADIGWYDLEIGFVMRTGTTIYAELANGVRFEARRAGLTLVTPPTWAGEFVGIQGDGDGDVSNDLATADGTPVDAADTDALYGAFFDSWYVDPADTMFTIPFDEAEDGPIRPDQIVTLADLDPADVAAAQQICTEAGLTAGGGLEACTFDVAVTGDSFWAENVAAPNLPSIPAVSLDPSIESVVALAATSSVAPDRPESGAGRIGQRYGADDYAVADGGDGVRLLRASEPCAIGVGPVAIVIVDDQPVESLPLVCGAVHAVPSGAFTLRVIDPTGGTPSYGLAIGPAGVVELGVLSEGEEYAGELGAGDRVVGELGLRAGSRLFVTAFDDTDCGPLLRVFDRTGEPQTRARAACLDLGPVELTGAPPFSIDIIGSQAGAYHFAIGEVGGDTVTTVSSGQNVDLVVSTPGQQASATIELAAGERIYIETVDNIDGDLVATDPNGAEAASAFSFADLGLITATADGVYTITINPDGPTTGIQRLLIHKAAEDTSVPAELGSEVRLRVSTPGQQASATIELAASERIYIETVDNIDGNLVATDPNGAEAASAFSFADLGLITATADGVYTITIEPDAATTGTQHLVVHRVADDTVVPARLGSEVRLRVLTPGQQASATIELAASERIYIETVDRIDGRLVVVGPDGSEVTSKFASQDLGLVTAPSSGTYTITVQPEHATTGTQVLLIRRP